MKRFFNRRFLNRAAFFLGVAAMLAAQLHIGHADVSHLKSGSHGCDLCQTISSGHVNAGPLVVPFHPVEKQIEQVSFNFVSPFSFLAASPRAPPAA